jgi:hypothetical protein
MITGAIAFSTNFQTVRHRVFARSTRCSQLKSTPENKVEGSEEIVEDYDVSCYIVNEEEMIADGEKPHVVCTGEPEEVSLPVVCITCNNHATNFAY